MHITSSPIPIHVARAYGLEAAQRAATANATRPSDPGSIVAGRVPGTVDFSPETAPSAQSSGAYRLYNRAADSIEVAVAVQVGRTLDVTG